MQLTQDRIEQHYSRGQLLDSIQGALADMGKDPADLAPADLTPVDEFHARGAQATVELASRSAWKPGLRVLDVGCGLGGSARYLASEHRCRVTGIDLTREYVDVANALTELVGLGDLVDVRRGDALELPFDDDTFDVVWTQHAQMNIADKRTFYAEIARVLEPGGRLLFHDIFQGAAGPPHYPITWAEDDAISFLVTPQEVRHILDQLGFTIHDWEDRSKATLEDTVAAMEQAAQSGPQPLGLHLLMGENIGEKVTNFLQSLRDNRIVVLQALGEKR